MPYGGVYSKISAVAIAAPTNPKLAALKATSFQGTTLRGLLLEAYAFSKIGQMLWGAIASFVLAAMLLVLVGLGQHARSTAPENECWNRRQRRFRPSNRISWMRWALIAGGGERHDPCCCARVKGRLAGGRSPGREANIAYRELTPPIRQTPLLMMVE